MKQEKPTSGDKHRPFSVRPQRNVRSSCMPNECNFNDLPTSDLQRRPRKDLPPIPRDSSCSSSLLPSKGCSRTDAGSPDHIYEEIPFFVDNTKNYDNSSANPTKTTLRKTPDAMPIRSVSTVVKLKPESTYLPSPNRERQLSRMEGGLLKTSDSKLILERADNQIRRNIGDTVFWKDVQSSDGVPSTTMQCNQNYGGSAWMTSQNCIRKSPQCSKLIGSRIATETFSDNNYDTISIDIERGKNDVTNMDRNNAALENTSDVIIGNKCDVSDVSIMDISDGSYESARDAIMINKTDVSFSNISDVTFKNSSDVICYRGFNCDKSSRQDDEDITFENEVEQILVDLDASLNRNSVHLCGQSDEYDSHLECSDVRSSPDSDVNQLADDDIWSAPHSTLLETSLSIKEKDPYHKRRGITGMHCLLSTKSRIPEELKNYDLINSQVNFRVNTNLSDSQGYYNYTPSERLSSCRLRTIHPQETAILDRSSSRLAATFLNASGCVSTISGARIISHNPLLEILIRKNFDRQTFLI